MITIYDQKNIDIRWEVFKVANNVHEDFSQSEIWMFLVSDEHKYPLHTTLDGNFVLARVDAGAFAPGTYSAVLMWLKNQETSKDLTRTELECIFALTPYEEEDTSRVEGDVTVTLKSMVATYGYDGLDAYERAIMLGRFWGSEEEWMQSLGDHDLANYYTKGEVDELIENVEVDLSGYYTKEQTDTKISEAAEGLRDEIEENTDAINDVSHRVSTNTQGIADNAGSIAANTEAITENTAEINQIKSGMNTMGGRVDELETEMDNFVGLNQSNYMGMFPDVNSLPAMTEKGWAWVGSDITAMAVYHWFNATDGWTRYGSNTYDLTDYTQVAAQVATIGSKLGNLEAEVAFIGDEEGSGDPADFTPSSDTVWNKQQTLSSAQKAQARANIGAVSNEEFAWQINVVNSKIDSIEPINLTNNGTITNLADEEDITSENNLLKLKDRYNYVILRSNKTFASQVTKVATIYEIRYDFDLDGTSVTIPSGCVLKFNGGKLSNGTLVGNNTSILAAPTKIFDTINGTFNIEYLLPEWFGAKRNGVHDDGAAIQKCLDYICVQGANHIKKCKFLQGTYLCNSTLNIQSPAWIELVGSDSNSGTTILAGTQMDALIKLTGTGKGAIKIESINFNGNRLGESYFDSDTKSFLYDNESLAKNGISGDFVYSNFTNCRFENFDGKALGNIYWDCHIDKCHIYFCGLGITVIQGNGSSIENTYFSTIGRTGIYGNDALAFNIVDSIFDHCGHSAICIGPNNRDFRIVGNYFENPSINGVILRGFNNLFTTEAIHPAIISSGKDFLNQVLNGDAVDFSRAYPSRNINIKDNFISTTLEQDNKCIVVGNINTGTIINNECIQDSFSVIGTALEPSGCEITNVDITHNVSNNKLLNKILLVSSYTTASTTRTSINNITSSDYSEPVYNNNFINDFLFYCHSGVIQEEDDLYKGFPIYKGINTNNGCTITSYYNSTDNYIFYKPSFFDGMLMYVKYFYKTANSDEWTERNTIIKTARFSIEAIREGDCFTLPIVGIVGYTLKDNRKYHNFLMPPFDTINTLTIHHKAGTLLKATKNPYINGMIISYENDSLVGNVSFKSVSAARTTVQSYIDNSYRNQYKGFTMFDTISSKMILWNGTAWVNMDGSALS